MTVDTRRKTFGYAIYLSAALLFAFNSTVSKQIMVSGLSALHLSQVRITAAFLVLLVIVALTNRSALRIAKREWRLLIPYGLLGLGATQFLYFFAIERMDIGLTLLIEFTAPIMVALWFRFGRHQPMRRGVWVAMCCALVGLALVAQVWQGLSFSIWAVLAAFGAAGCVATYYVLGESQVTAHEPRDPLSLTMWGMGIAAVVWAIAQPWWNFPWGDLARESAPFPDSSIALPVGLLAVWMVVLGTAVPFWLSVAALTRITATQASTVGMLEPIMAIGIAWLLLGEALTPVQMVGSAVVLGSVLLAERSR